APCSGRPACVRGALRRGRAQRRDPCPHGGRGSPVVPSGMLSPMSDPKTITLRGGRTLGYREYGDPDGAPVVNCHGGTLCGLDLAAWSEAARALGVRVVSPD